MTISVVLLTYNRLVYAKRTLVSAHKYLRLDGQNIHWHVASDGDAPEYLASLGALLSSECGIAYERITYSNSQRGGYGKNYNLAMQTVHLIDEWVLPLEDDWALLRELNVAPILRDMKALDIGCARLGYIGYTQELRGKLVHGECGHWLVFDPDSSEPHVFAGHPRIEHVQWSRDVGPWLEGLNPGETEFEVAHRRAARRHVAWPLDLVKPHGDLFVHIGTNRSY